MENRNKSAFISPFGYIGYNLLWAIPVIGWLFWIFSCFSKAENKRNYARSAFCALLLLIPMCLLWIVLSCVFIMVLLVLFI